MTFPTIRALREDHDWTQQQVADMLYLNRRTYSAYENGVNSITPELLIQLAALYKTSVDYLLGLTDVKKPYPRKGQLSSF
nr:helix-turn-helix transcriptional regulator [uncultured Pseudoflavonifractor sp.]